MPPMSRLRGGGTKTTKKEEETITCYSLDPLKTYREGEGSQFTKKRAGRERWQGD